MATTVGATHFVNTSNANPEELEQIVENGRFDVVLDTTGSPQLIGEFVEKLSENGRFIMVGQPRPGQQVSFTGDSSFFGSRGKRIQSSQGGQTSPSDDIPRYVRLAQAGRLPFEQLVTHSYHLDEINNAFDDLRAGRVGRALVEFEPEEV
jgi:Zn-dependent alcohol dehydrogenase